MYLSLCWSDLYLVNDKCALLSLQDIIVCSLTEAEDCDNSKTENTCFLRDCFKDENNMARKKISSSSSFVCFFLLRLNKDYI